MFLGIFKDFWRLQNKKIVPLYFWLFLYSFITSLDNNFFICSYLRDEIFGKDENTFFVILFYILYSFIPFFFKKIKKNKNIIAYSILYTHNMLIEIILFRFKQYILKYTTFKHIIIFNFQKIKSFNIFLLNSYKTYYINSLIIYILKLIESNFIIWQPIFKTYSIFGFYKSTRLNYTDFKNENLKRLKY
uniref:Ymf75 n=1 Tax=Tetrahymena rostrata TaxID=5909 RepID=A0A650DE82_TETRO|nr:Ymf75 [Tetrahymena rostrata]QGS65263.1 Ymf75 [Tetrahymena rostrata]